MNREIPFMNQDIVFMNLKITFINQFLYEFHKVEYNLHELFYNLQKAYFLTYPILFRLNLTSRTLTQPYPTSLTQTFPAIHNLIQPNLT